MEFGEFVNLPLIFTLLLFLFVTISLIKQSKFQTQRLPLPPGPYKLPFIGHLHHLVGGIPHQILRVLAQKQGPLMYLKLGELSAVVISSAGLAKQMMTTHDLKFADRPMNFTAETLSYGYKDVVLAPYGAYWRQVRKICTVELLSAKRVKSLWSVREEEVLSFLARISLMAGSSMNLTQEIFALTNDITARAAFGKTCKDKEELFSAIKDLTNLFSGFSVSDVFPSLTFLELVTGNKRKLIRAQDKLDRMLSNVIREHREKSKDESVREDLLDVLLRLQDQCGEFEFPITIDNVKAIAWDMFVGGTDTSSTLLDWTFVELLRNPRIMEKAQAEVRNVFKRKNMIDEESMKEFKYLGLVIREALRLHPPFPLLVPRECRERCEMEGYEIPKGTKVIVNAWAIGRDPDHWADPQRFEPERFEDLSKDYNETNFDYIPFGAGRRMCPGILFGIANVEVPLAFLLYHFDWTLGNEIKPEELDMAETISSVGRRTSDLYVIPTAYKS
ncbi:hypothetical protein ACHQM5_021602 [Ranunculus cassubicifolius]